MRFEEASSAWTGKRLPRKQGAGASLPRVFPGVFSRIRKTGRSPPEGLPFESLDNRDSTTRGANVNR